MLISGEKYHNSGLQPVVLGIVALYCYHYFILNTFSIILTVPSKQGFCNALIVKPKSNFSIHFSKCFVTVLNSPLLPVQLLPFSFQKFHTLTHNNLCIFLLLSFQCEYQIGMRDLLVCIFLLFLSTVISGQLFSRVLSVCIGKSHKILQFSDSKTFFGLCIYHFSTLLNPFFTQLPMKHFGNVVMSHLFVLFLRQF